MEEKATKTNRQRFDKCFEIGVCQRPDRSKTSDLQCIVAVNDSPSLRCKHCISKLQQLEWVQQTGGRSPLTGQYLISKYHRALWRAK